MTPPPRSVLLAAAKALEAHARTLEALADFREKNELNAPASELATLRARGKELDSVAEWLDYCVDGPRCLGDRLRQ